jgi:hypothetical protein
VVDLEGRQLSRSVCLLLAVMLLGACRGESRASRPGASARGPAPIVVTNHPIPGRLIHFACDSALHRCCRQHRWRSPPCVRACGGNRQPIRRTLDVPAGTSSPSVFAGQRRRGIGCSQPTISRRYRVWH